MQNIIDLVKEITKKSQENVLWRNNTVCVYRVLTLKANNSITVRTTLKQPVQKL